MSKRSRIVGWSALLLAAAALLAGCGGSSKSAEVETTPQPPLPASGGNGSTTTRSGSQSPGALTAEAQQAAAGDVPDNQVFLRFGNAQVGYSMKYPEGWSQRGSGARVTFIDKNNIVRIAVSKGAGVSVAGVAADMNRLERQTPSLRFDAPTRMAINGKRVVKVVYTTASAPNPVTGKQVTLVVDRYYVPGAGKHAVVDLGTPQGVDNVDAYRLMIESFRWR